MFADDPSEEGFPFRQKCLSRNRENGRVEKEKKNDMAKKKTFQEYTQEALLEIEKTEAALKQASSRRNRQSTGSRDP